MIEGTKITLDKDRTLVFDMWAMRCFESATGVNILQADIWDADMVSVEVDGKKTEVPIPKISATNLLAFLWSGLLHEDPDLKLREVGQMIQPGQMSEYAILGMTEWFRTLPDQEEGKKKAASPQR